MNIIRGKIPCAKKVVIYGPEGIGKSTFASHFPEAVFIDTEGSTNSMDVARLPKPTSWQMILEQIAYIKNNTDVCKTLVIDTIDWAEAMCIQSICDKHQKKGIEDFGYGNGYVYVKEEMGRFLNRLTEVVEAGVNVVLTAHAQIRKFEQPEEMGAYDRWELKLGKKTSSQTSPLIKEWADMLLFANYKTLSVATDDKGKKFKAQGGTRVMYTAHHACWDAKNRYGLPEEVPFDYGSIAHIIEEHTSSQQKTSVQKNVNTPMQEPSKSTPEPVPQKESDPIPVQSQPVKTQQMEMNLTPDPASKNFLGLDERIPKSLRDLMLANSVGDWEIKAACEARGYVPFGTQIWDYDKANPGIIEGLLVPDWPKVFAVIKEMREKEEIPFK